MKKDLSLTNISLIVAVIALLLAVLPPIIIESKIRGLEAERVEYKKKYSIKIKNMEFGFANGEKTEEYQKNKETIKQLRHTKETLITASLVAGAIAFVIGIYVVISSRKKKVGIGSIGIACIAMAWQYISAGVTIGVAVFILIALVVNFGV